MAGEKNSLIGFIVQALDQSVACTGFMLLLSQVSISFVASGITDYYSFGSQSPKWG